MALLEVHMNDDGSVAHTEVHVVPLSEYDRGWHDGHMHGIDICIGAHYTHRNGEATPPTVEGWFWVEWQPDMMIPVLVWDIAYWSGEHWDKSVYPCAIYGPIPQPRKEVPHGH